MMKKFFSLFFFILTIVIFIIAMVFSIDCAIDCSRQLAELAAREAGGHELLGVPVDVLVLGDVFFSIIGLIISGISWKIAQYRVVRIMSGSLYFLFLLPGLISYVILMI